MLKFWIDWCIATPFCWVGKHVWNNGVCSGNSLWLSSLLLFLKTWIPKKNKMQSYSKILGVNGGGDLVESIRSCWPLIISEICLYFLHTFHKRVLAIHTPSWHRAWEGLYLDWSYISFALFFCHDSNIHVQQTPAILDTIGTAICCIFGNSSPEFHILSAKTGWP